MLTVQDFVDKYEQYTDEELYTVHAQINNYSEDAEKALQIVLQQKGGPDALIQRLEAKAVILNEKRRIGQEAALLGSNGVDAAFIKNTTSSSILSSEELNELIEDNVAIAEAKLNDKKVDSETVAKSILAGVAATIAGSAFWALQLIYFGATHILLIIGMALICYGIVKLITKKTYNNTAVILSASAAFVLSILIGYLIYAAVGYIG